MPIPGRFDILDPDGVATVNTHSDPHVLTGDILRSIRVVRAHSADVVLAPRKVEHGHLAEDEAEREESLRGGAEVVVAYTHDIVTHPLGGAGGSEADAAEGRTLERYRAREPPLGGGAEGKGRARDAKGLR